MEAVKKHMLNREEKKRRAVFKICMYALMVFVAAILIFPYFYMVMKSLMTWEEVISLEFRIFPAKPQFANYGRILQDSGYIAAFGNTMKVILFNLVAVPVSATFIAFGFAAANLREKRRCSRLCFRR